MDFIKKAVDSAKSGGSENKDQNQAAGGNPQQGGGEQQDYGDKAFDFAAKKSGHSMDRGTEEKITDGARGAYEKITGNKVDPKYSN